MTFNSISFLFFFPIVAFGYFLLPHRFRWMFLLLASCVFYMAFVPKYILVLFTMIVIDYIAGRFIEKSSGHKKKIFLTISILSNLGILAFFKYSNFLSANLVRAAHLLDWNYSLPLLSIALPIGLSFHAFQALSYTIEVYRGNQAAEKHFGIYALYVMFFPQLVAGPIERPQNLLHQFKEPHEVDYARVTNGLKRMAWGFFKKLVIADRLALAVNYVYGNVHGTTAPALLMAAVFFAFQLYSDFSGYCDIALGAAQVLGFKLMENFQRPYFSKSIAEFWRRWHISLSSWFRDYLYIPLGGNRVGPWRWALNTFTVFLVSGLWHGAGWTYIFMGGIYGFYICFSRATAQWRSRLIKISRLDKAPSLLKFLQIFTTFTLVCVAWIFFRALSLSDAWYVAAHLPAGLATLLAHPAGIMNLGALMGINNRQLVLSLLVILTLVFVEASERTQNLWARLSQKPTYVRWPVYYALILAILFLGVFGGQRFIYFQF